MLLSRIAALAALSSLSGAAAQAQAIPPVQVIYLQSYAYNPEPIVLRAGRPVTLQFINRAGSGHDFTAPAFFKSARVLAGRVEGGKIDLLPGQIAQVTLVPAPGQYPVHCRRPFHKMLGMRAMILVQ
jgi:plastocyanin